MRSKTHQVWIPGATILSCKRISLVEWLSCAILAIRQPCLWVPWKGISWAKDASMRPVIGLVSSPQMRKCKLINEGGSPWMRKCKSINEGESPCSHWITHTSKVDLIFKIEGHHPGPADLRTMDPMSRKMKIEAARRVSGDPGQIWIGSTNLH